MMTEVRRQKGARPTARRAPWNVLMVAALVAGCVLGPQNGADAGDAGAATGTIGDQCQTIWAQYCARAAACLVTSDQAQCVRDYVQLCCEAKCSHAAVTPDVRINACARDVANETCNDVAQAQNA